MSTANKNEGNEMVSIGGKVPQELKAKFRVKAALEGKGMSQYIRELLEAEVEDDRIAQLLDEMDDEQVEQMIEESAAADEDA